MSLNVHSNLLRLLRGEWVPMSHQLHSEFDHKNNRTLGWPWRGVIYCLIRCRKQSPVWHIDQSVWEPLGHIVSSFSLPGGKPFPFKFSLLYLFYFPKKWSNDQLLPTAEKPFSLQYKLAAQWQKHEKCTIVLSTLFHTFTPTIKWKVHSLTHSRHP